MVIHVIGTVNGQVNEGKQKMLDEVMAAIDEVLPPLKK